jgi:hypothetical protein
MRENELQVYLKSLISEELKKVEIELKEKEAKQIVHALIPEIDKLVAEKVKSHFVELAKFISEKFT